MIKTARAIDLPKAVEKRFRNSATLGCSAACAKTRASLTGTTAIPKSPTGSVIARFGRTSIGVHWLIALPLSDRICGHGPNLHYFFTGGVGAAGGGELGTPTPGLGWETGGTLGLSISNVTFGEAEGAGLRRVSGQGLAVPEKSGPLSLHSRAWAFRASLVARRFWLWDWGLRGHGAIGHEDLMLVRSHNRCRESVDNR